MEPKNTWNLDKTAEDQLIRLAAQGHETACLKLWSLYHGLLVNETHRHLRGNPEQLAEERSLASLAFMQAVHDYDPGRNIHFAAFLQQRIRMTLYNAFRQRREDWTHTCYPDADTDGQDFWETHGGTTADTASPEAIVSRQQLLRTLIHCLPAREKQLIVLLYLLDLPQCEIAGRMHITHQAVTRLKQRTLQQLRRNMERPPRP